MDLLCSCYKAESGFLGRFPSSLRLFLREIMEGAASHDEREAFHMAEDEEEYEEASDGSRLLGFMFGNVDNSGDLDVDYLDEDAKEHLSALADKLGPSLTDMDLIKYSPTTTDASEQDYDEKAEDAIDYEDIDEQYDGPEVQAATEEDHLVPRKEYLSSDAFLSSLNSKASIFDEEDYDEDEETVKESNIKKNSDDSENLFLAGADLKIVSVKTISSDDNIPFVGSLNAEELTLEQVAFTDDQTATGKLVNPKSETSLPVLCIEDGMVILRFSEIFGIHDALKKADRRYFQKHQSLKERDKMLDFSSVTEEDEEDFLRSSDHNLSFTKNLSLSVLNGKENDKEMSYAGLQNKDIYFGSLPLKDDLHVVESAFQRSLLSPKFYPLDQQDWEDCIIWGNSPQLSFDVSKNDSYSEHEFEGPSEEFSDLRYWSSASKSSENDGILPSNADFIVSAENGDFSYHELLERSSHRHKLGTKSHLRNNLGSEELKTENMPTEVSESSTILHRIHKLTLMNQDLLNGLWLDHVIWDSDEATPKPKLILDLQDKQMLFEILDHNDSEHLSSRAGAMVVIRPSNSNLGECSDVYNQGLPLNARFNISNDKYYSNRKVSQQAKSHAKKRASHGIKVLHSVPALRLQTMKPKLSNKDIANFHRPKALWYPRDNEIAAKAQGTLSINGPIKIVLITLVGKGVKLHVDAEETLSSVKLKISKKLEIKMSEEVKVFYSGRELEDDKSLAFQKVRPNSVLYLVRTRIQIWPKAQRLPGESKPLRPPGAFKKKSELSVKDGHLFLMEYCEERPLLLGNIGMGARFCTYYQKLAPNDQTAASLRNGNNGFGTVLTLDPADRSPFLGDIGPGCIQSCLETNMYRSPIFPHKLHLTDYLLVRSAKGALSLRRIDRLYAVGQQEPHMEVLSPGSKGVQSYLVNRMLVYVYRKFRANEKPGLIPSIRADELAALFPGLTDAFMRKRLKLCADLKKGAWVKRNDFRISSEEELRRMLTPENVCSYESMQVGLYRLKRLGISRLTHPIGLSSAMNQLPDEAITLAAASHIERELQITSWNLTCNFVACTNQDRENIERLEITGVGDPSGRGLGFSYVRVTPKAPIMSAVVKKKAVSKGGSTVTGTDADLRRLSMDAAREVLLKFNVPKEQIDKLTRWHRIALVRKLSSEQAASGVKVEAMPLSKFARGQRMSFLQLQQQTREKCQEIWDRQFQSLSAANGDENDSDSEANSDLDSFAGDLENLLDAEEFEKEAGNGDAMIEKADVARGLKMRRCHSFSLTEEEIEDDKAEAAFIRRLLDDESEFVKKKKLIEIEVDVAAGPVKKFAPAFRQILGSAYADALHTPKDFFIESKEVENSVAETNPWKFKLKKGNIKNDDMTMGLLKKGYKTPKDGTKVYKEKKHADRRDTIVCGACGQAGHMRTNKNCPKYGEEAEPLEMESASVRAHPPDGTNRPHVKVINKKAASTVSREAGEDASENILEKQGAELQVKIPPLKFRCGGPPSADKLVDEKSLPVLWTPTPDRPVSRSIDLESKQASRNLILPTKVRAENVFLDTPKPTVRILPPQVMVREPPKKIVFKQPKFASSDTFGKDSRDHDEESRKMKKIADLSLVGFSEPRKFSHPLQNDEIGKYIRRSREEDEKGSRNTRRIFEDRGGIFENRNYEPFIQHTKKKRTKRHEKKPNYGDDYLMDHRQHRTEHWLPERGHAMKRRNAGDDTGYQEHALPTKRRRGAEVLLSNILESIVDQLRDRIEISYLFLKPVTRKEAPDYFNVIKEPMDLSTMRDKVRNMEYRSREDFRHDMWQIAYNAHKYNLRRNPGIPPLADQLLELCDYLIEEKDAVLTEAEAAIDSASNI